jgi:hypothetical protein
MVRIEQVEAKMNELNDILRKEIREKGRSIDFVAELGKLDGWNACTIKFDERASKSVAPEHSVVVDMTQERPLWTHVTLYYHVYEKLNQEALDNTYNGLIDIETTMEDI